MEIWEDISLHVVKPYVGLITDSKYSQLAFAGLTHVCLIQFNYDMKIRELPEWLAKGIVKIIEHKNNECREHVHAFNEFLNETYAKNRQDSVRFLAEEIADILNNHNIQDVVMIL